MKITEHIYFYPCPGEGLTRPSNTIVIVSESKHKQIMIDPGANIKKRVDNLITGMKKDGLDINNTSEIWLTHSHIDHFEAMHSLFKRFGEQRLVRCHPLAKSNIADPKLRKTFISREAKRILKFMSLKDRKKVNRINRKAVWNMAKKEIRNLWQKASKIKPFLDGEIVEFFPIKVKIMFLPGHASDEIGFWIAKEKVLILGDLINILQPEKDTMICKLVFNTFDSDLNQAFESLKKMKQIKEKTKKFLVFSTVSMPDILFTPHSAPVIGEKKIQGVFEQLIFKTQNYKAIARKLIEKEPNLTGDKLVKKLARALHENHLLTTERRFIASVILKSFNLKKQN